MQTVERRGWNTICPVCGEAFFYTKFNLDKPTAFFYCDKRSDVLLRKTDQSIVAEAFRSSRSSDSELKQLWEEFVEKAPPCPCGGRFTLWQYVKCPHCKTELPYPKGPEFVHNRIHEAQILILNGAFIVGDKVEDSYEVIVTV